MDKSLPELVAGGDRHVRIPTVGNPPRKHGRTRALALLAELDRQDRPAPQATGSRRDRTRARQRSEIRTIATAERARRRARGKAQRAARKANR